MDRVTMHVQRRTRIARRFWRSASREIARIRAARPALESRLDRAGTLLVTQLSCSPRLRPIKVRIAADGSCRLLVRSMSSSRTTYSVVPDTFKCSCPDARRQEGCKHSIACFVLERTARAQKKGCGACGRGWVHRAMEILNPATGEITQAINTYR